MRFGNRFGVREFRQGKGKTQGGVPTILLETVGVRSGETRQVALGYVTEPAGSWLIIGSLAGASRNPAWVHNLANDPDATIHFADGVSIPVSAELLEGEALAGAWERIAVEAPEYVKYQSKTDREIPVIRLRRR